jgi:anti-sigma factor RsiW
VPDHPDHEQLAGFQAGDGDRRQRSDVEAHLAGCPSCAELVASVEDARRGLILLEEQELPPGLHDRLAAAVAGEAAQVLPQRPTPWYRRPVAWGAAAALLLAALLVPLLDQGGRDLDTAGGGGGDQAQEAAGAAGGAELPVIRVPGEVSAAVVRSRLAGDDLAKQALERARADAQSSGGTAAGPPRRESQGPAAATQSPGQGQDDGYRSDGAPSSPGATADQRSCLAAATSAADPADRPLVPAFYVEGTYKGRQATVLVTTSGGQPGRADLWVFPRGDCSTAPLATERVR